LFRLLSIAAAAQAATLSLYGPAFAASDITIAAIATGRLYVVGTTERPHTPVVLDDQFRTTSDDKGKFQYELTYHPARCIVSAVIEGKAYEAVVSDCGQQCPPGPSRGSEAVVAARSEPLPSRPAGLSGSAGAPEPKGLSQPTEAAVPAGPTRTNPVPEERSAVIEPPPQPSVETRGANPISNPPLPPKRPIFQTDAQARPPQAAQTTQNAKPERSSDPRGVEGWLND
jgi:hypothetical protein